MGYLDYSPPDVGDLSPAMRDFGDALTEVMKRRQARETQDKQLQFEREQEERKFKQAEMQSTYQNRIIDQREKREQLEFNRRQSMDNAAAAKAAMHADSPQAAAAMAQNIVNYDPTTGKEVSRGRVEAGPMRDIGPEPALPAKPQFPAAEAGAVIPDIAQALPGMPPELAARLRGQKKTLPNISLNDAPQSDPDALARMQGERQSLAAGADERRGRLFVDQINDDGIATVLDENGNKAHVEARPGWAEGKLIDRKTGEPVAVSSQRFEPQAEGYSYEAPPDRFEKATAAYDQFQGAQRGYQEAERALPGQQQAFAAEKRRAEAERPYTMKFGPNDPGTTFDFQTQRYAARDEAASRFLETLPDNMSDRDRATASQIHAAIKAGTVDPAKAGAMFQKERLQGSTQDFNAGQGALRDKNRIDVANINSRKPGLVLQERRFAASQDKDIRKETRKDITDWLKASGLETAPKQLAAMDQSIKQLHGNGREQQAALVGMARATQGDNRFSDADYRVFVEKGGVGTLDQVANTVQKLIDGEFGDETIAVASKMATALRAVYDQRLRDAATDGNQEFVHNEIYDPQVAESVLEQRLGKGYYQRESGRGRGGPPEIDARSKAKAKGGGSKTVKAGSVEDLLKVYEGTR